MWVPRALIIGKTDYPYIVLFTFISVLINNNLEKKKRSINNLLIRKMKFSAAATLSQRFLKSLIHYLLSKAFFLTLNTISVFKKKKKKKHFAFP